MKNGKDVPAAKAANIPKNIWILSFESAYRKRAKNETTFICFYSGFVSFFRRGYLIC